VAAAGAERVRLSGQALIQQVGGQDWRAGHAHHVLGRCGTHVYLDAATSATIARSLKSGGSGMLFLPRLRRSMLLAVLATSSSGLFVRVGRSHILSNCLNTRTGAAVFPAAIEIIPGGY